MMLIRDNVFRLTLIAAGLLLGTQQASANFVVNAGEQIRVLNGPGAGNGGEFKVDAGNNGFASNPGPGADDDFRTFCVQTQQNLNYGETLTIFAISDKTEGSSGLTGSGSPSPGAGQQYLTARVSALYREFLKGKNLAGNSFVSESLLTTTYLHNGNINSGVSGDLLQQAIWKYQGQSGYGAVSNIYTVAVEALALSLSWTANELAKDLGGVVAQQYGGVKILNIRRSNGSQGQDLLYYGGPDYIVDVPEPSSLCLFGIGVLGAVLVRRRRVVEV